MEIDLTEKEIFVIRDYIEDMISLFDEKDMISESEPLYLSHSNITVYKQELILLGEKLSFY